MTNYGIILCSGIMRRCGDAEAADAQPAPDVATFCRVTRPLTNGDGLYAAALRFGEQRVMAILSALVGFCYLIGGFTNRQLSSALKLFSSRPTPVGGRPTICAGSSAKSSSQKSHGPIVISSQSSAAGSQCFSHSTPICPKNSRRATIFVPRGVVSRKLSTTSCRQNWSRRKLDRFVNLFWRIVKTR